MPTNPPPGPPVRPARDPLVPPDPPSPSQGRCPPGRPPAGRGDASDRGRAPVRRRPGRPPGSVSLTDDIARTVCSFIRAGVFDHVAAEAAGISPRTLRDWVARGEGTHPTRSCTPKLRRFARDVRTAKAEVRAGAEARVYREQPKHWLAWAARSRPERQGWTDPDRVPDVEPGSENTVEERMADYRARMAGRADEAARAATSECEIPDCRCAYHRRRYEDELRRSLAPSD
jgi:hypothetical protein